MPDIPPHPVVAGHDKPPVDPDRPSFAVIDLGSNSFNLLICYRQHSSLAPLAHCKQIVQLVRDADAEGNLHVDALQRGLQCLRQFRELLDKHLPDYIDVLGTEALRRAPNASAFLDPAQIILGYPVSIITAEEEAFLGYLGVRLCYPIDSQSALVVDIGGASTELTLGSGWEVRHWQSLNLGCVALANQFFHTSNPAREEDRINACYQYCRAQVDGAAVDFHRQGWTHTLGAAGIMRIIVELLMAGRYRISRQDLEKLMQDLIQKKQLRDSIPESLRHDVLPAGILLLTAIFDAMGVSSMTVTGGNLKQGRILQRLQKMQLPISHGLDWHGDRR